MITEQQNPHTLDIDLMNTREIIRTINNEDSKVITAVARVERQIEEVVDRIVESILQGGRLIYVGAGTSGRLGVLDAVEIEPTFGVNEEVITALIAGGKAAMFKAQEGCEDDPNMGKKDLMALNLNNKDVVFGIAASGSTPFVAGALCYGQSVSATTIALSCNPDALINEHADFCICPIVGPEVITGSTRMKAGSAQKMILNIISTTVMIKLGKTYQNLMVDLKVSNQKLHKRAINMLMELTGLNQKLSEELLSKANDQVKIALVMHFANLDREKSEQLLARHHGFIRKAIASLN